MGQTFDGDSRILYVPVETRAREWDAKLLFSLYGAAANFQVVVGPKWLFNANIEALPRGLFGCKTLNRLDASAMEYAAAVGHTIYAWDDEGPGQILPEVYLKNIDPAAVEYAGRIYAWGEHQATMLSRKFPQAASKIEAAGNPRWDLLRPEHRTFFDAEARALRAAHGRIILVNTNFGTFNSWWSDGIASITAVAQETGAFEKSNEADQRMLTDIHDFEKGVFESYAGMLAALSAGFPDHAIVLRPHPTEKIEAWEQVAAGLSNVKILREGMVIPWILAAEAVVQNSCTTGIEALTLGRPVVSYCKFQTPLLEWHLTSHATPRVADEAALVGTLRQLMTEPQRLADATAQGLQVLGRHIARLNGETSSVGILKSLHFLAKRSEKKATFDRVFSLSKGLRPYPKTEYMNLKFPPVSGSQLTATISRLTQGHPHLDRVAIQQFAESAFYMKRIP